MRSVVAAAALSLFLALLGTPLYIKFLVKRGYGQFIRDDGPTTHKTKRGTPTMGGVVIIGATIVGYFGSHLLTMTKPDGTVSLGLTPSSLLVLGLMTGLGFVGWLDDFIKISKQRSLGLRSAQKLFGQLLVGSAFAVAAVTLTNARGTPLASTKISFVRDIGWLDLFAAGSVVGLILVVLWMNLIVAGTSNGVNLTDGLDGLAIMTRTELLVILLGGLFVIITLSVIIQVASFKMTGKRVFRMAPLQHHFELKGWNEVTIVIRFWIIAGVCAALALGLFYAEWVAGGTI